MAEKIRISSDEVNSAAVDQRLAELGAANPDQPSGAGEPGGFNWKQLLYNTLVYSTLFGLAGGLVAGMVGEMFWLVAPSGLEEYAEYREADDELIERFNTGELSEFEYDYQSEQLIQRYKDNPYVEIENDPLLDEMEMFSKFDEQQGSDAIESLVFVAYWFASVGLLLAFCLSIADQAVGQNLRGVMVNGSVALALALVGTGFGACIASVAYNQMGGGEGGNFLLQVFARAVGWGVFGGFLSVAPGIVLKNWKRLTIGLAGGLIGGTLGGALFDPIEAVTGSVVASRVVAITAIGTLTGLGTGLLENAAKTGWVKVVQGLIAGKQFILYKDTTYIGSSPQCEIYLFKDANVKPRHAAIHKRGGRHELESLGATTYVNGSPVKRAQLKTGDQIQISSTVLRFMEKKRG